MKIWQKKKNKISSDKALLTNMFLSTLESIQNESSFDSSSIKSIRIHRRIVAIETFACKICRAMFANRVMFNQWIFANYLDDPMTVAFTTISNEQLSNPLEIVPKKKKKLPHELLITYTKLDFVCIGKANVHNAQFRWRYDSTIHKVKPKIYWCLFIYIYVRILIHIYIYHVLLIYIFFSLDSNRLIFLLVGLYKAQFAFNKRWIAVTEKGFPFFYVCMKFVWMELWFLE